MTNHERSTNRFGDVSLDAPSSDRERDGVGALHDTEAEAGDEEEIADAFDLDRKH